MAKHGKKYQKLLKLIDREATYEPLEAIELVKKAATAKFDETVEVAVRLGCRPEKTRSSSSWRSCPASRHR